MDSTQEYLWRRITALNERVWDRRVNGNAVRRWLSNFDGRFVDVELENLIALYLLSQFMYFGAKEIRVMLRAMYRDQYLIPIVSELSSGGFVGGAAAMQALVMAELSVTRFLGVGGPSKSGNHLLYPFRQENRLEERSFLDPSAIFSWKSDGAGARQPTGLMDGRVRRYVFIDDVCGSGDTALDNYDLNCAPIRRFDPSAKISYLCMFGCVSGLDRIRSAGGYSFVGAVNELDDSYRVLGENSRYLSALPDELNRQDFERFVRGYGSALMPSNPLGFDGGELMISFEHNTPDNTLPIFWCDDHHVSGCGWHPAFRRHR